MNLKFEISKFIQRHITKRSESLFVKDIQNNQALLTERISGKNILVIGGAGTIGSSFIRETIKFSPRKVVVVDINENGLTELVRDLRSTDGCTVPTEFLTYPINFSDRTFYKILKSHGPFEIIANFAAHKHVRSEKDQFSIEAMIENNVLNAQTLLDQLLANPPERFFCVSTDKAANPVNVMGASKKLMEGVILSYQDRILVTTARFANVAFSNGSLLFGFIERMMKNQPLSAPLDIKRYFVSPEESGQLCMLACILGESGNIFFPKLEETQMIGFDEIASDFIKSNGYSPIYAKSEEEAKALAADSTNIAAGKYPIYLFESDTSGEKSYEEFYTPEEKINLTSFESLGFVLSDSNQYSLESTEQICRSFAQLFSSASYRKEDIIHILTKAIPSFHHIEKGKNLDQKM